MLYAPFYFNARDFYNSVFVCYMFWTGMSNSVYACVDKSGFIMWKLIVIISQSQLSGLEQPSIKVEIISSDFLSKYWFTNEAVQWKLLNDIETHVWTVLTHFWSKSSAGEERRRALMTDPVRISFPAPDSVTVKWLGRRASSWKADAHGDTHVIPSLLSAPSLCERATLQISQFKRL